MTPDLANKTCWFVTLLVLESDLHLFNFLIYIEGNIKQILYEKLTIFCVPINRSA